MALLPELLPAGPVELRRWSPSLADELRTAVSASLAELHPWMPWASEPPTEAGIRTVVAEGASAFDAGTQWPYVVALPGHDDVLGSVGLHPRGPEGSVEIGYWIRSDVTGRGYATESARALTTAAFAHLESVDRVEIWVDSANRRSNAVAARLGFRIDRDVERAADAPGQSGLWHVHVMERSGWPTDGRQEPEAAGEDVRPAIRRATTGPDGPAAPPR